MKTPKYYPTFNKPFHQWKVLFSNTNDSVSLIFKPLQLLAFLGLLGQPQFSLAQLPVDPHVVHGSAAIDTAGQHMTITNSSDTIINWQEFSIGNNNSIHFQQPEADSQVLNRVTGNDSSQIFGSLSSNGGVWLINPHGVLFGENARIDVGSLIASTLDISNLDFLAHNYQFHAVENGLGNVVNQGEIRTSLGGRVWMTGEQVQNEGLIQSPEGNIVLAAGKSIELIDSGAPNVTVLVSAPENAAVNLGSMITPSGQVDVHGSIVNQQGIVQADSITTDESGHIVLTAKDSLTLSGRIDASNPHGQGGKIEVTADTVKLSQVTIDAGGIHGGTIHLGGGWQGSGDLPHAREVIIDADSKVKVNGKIDGGEIAVWTTKSSKHYGSLEAKDGGQIEFSSKGAIHQLGDIVTGPGGNVLYDPKNLFIIESDIVEVDGDGALTVGVPLFVEAINVNDDEGLVSVEAINIDIDSDEVLDAFDETIDVDGDGVPDATDETIDVDGDGIPDASFAKVIRTDDELLFDFIPEQDSYIFNSTIIELLDNQTNVTLQVNNDIYVQSEIVIPDPDGNLTLQAGRNINFNADVFINDGNLTAIAGHRDAITDFRDQGIPALTINQGVTLDAGTGTAVLAAIDGNFINKNGDDAISTDSDPTLGTQGRWLIYDAEPNPVDEGISRSIFNKRYDITFDGTTPDFATNTGNWFLYSVVPVLQVAPDAPDAPDSHVTITYGESDDVEDLNFTTNFSGFIDGDSSDTAGTTGSANWSIEAPVPSSSGNLSADFYNVAYVDGLTSTLGYQFTDDAASSNELLVSPKLINAEISIEDKIYDSTKQVPLENISSSLNGVIVGDDVFLSEVSASFADPNVGLNNQGEIVPVSVTISEPTQPLAGIDANNYSLSNPFPISTTAFINPKLLTAEISIKDKIYDSTTKVPLENISSSLNGVIAGDDVFLSEVSASFADPNVGLNNQGEIVPVSVTISELTQPLTGTDAGNYSLSNPFPISTTAFINPKQMTVIANPTTSVIGLPDLNLTGHPDKSDFVDGESESVFTAPIQWTTPATPESFPGVYPIEGTIFARNYEAVQDPSNATALTIEPINRCCDIIRDVNTSIIGTKPIVTIPAPYPTEWKTPPWRVYGEISELYYDSGQPEMAVLFGKLAVNAISPLNSLINLEDKIRVHERLTSILIEEERFAEARFYALPMLKRLEYKHFTGNHPTGMFQKTIPEVPVESDYVKPAQKLIMDVIRKSKEYWLLNEKKLKGQQLTNDQEESYNELNLYYKELKTCPNKKLEICPVNPMDVTRLAENTKEVLDSIELLHRKKVSGKPLTENQVKLDAIKAIHPNASADLSNFSNLPDDIKSVMAEAGFSTKYDFLPTEDIDYITNISKNLKQLKYDHEDHVMLLFYLITDEKLSILLFRPDQIEPIVVHDILISRSILNNLITEFRRKLKRFGPNNLLDSSEEARKLYTILIEPIRTVLDEFKVQHKPQPLTLALLKTGALRYVPFSALKNGDSYLIEDFALTTYIEAETNLKRIVGHNASIPLSIVAFGASKSQDKQFTDLRHVEDELNYIVLLPSNQDIQDNSVASKGILPGRKFLNLDFTRRQLKIASNDHARVLHLASHFKLESSSVDSFLLAGDGSHITLEELRKFNMSDKELVALSACETALGILANSASGGKEVESLALTLFEHSKPHAVLASLWEIADQSTATFMQQFYLHKNNKRLSKAEAIRQAQLYFINGQAGDDKTSQNKRKDPYYWAPFILMGNWR